MRDGRHTKEADGAGGVDGVDGVVAQVAGDDDDTWASSDEPGHENDDVIEIESAA